MGELPAWFDKRKLQNSRSKQHELRRARETGGRRQPGSGSSRRAPQDIKSDDYLEQHKYTDKDRITIRAKDLIKILLDSLDHGREPGMVVDFDQHNVRMIITIERTNKR